VHREFLSRTTKHVDAHPDKKFTPAIAAFRDLIEGEPRIYMYFVQMFEEIPRKEPYMRDVTGAKPQIRDYRHMLAVLNHIVSTAPSWTNAEESVGVVGVPMCAVFDYPMGTPR
jgi:phosphatidylserine decarboxylase